MISIPELDQNIRKELGSFFSTQAHTEADRIRYINSSVKDLCMKRDWDFNKFRDTFTVTTVNTQTVMKTVLNTFHVYDSAGTPMEILNFEDYYEKQSLSQTEWYVWVWGNTFQAPQTGAYVITYSALPEAITSLSGNLNIPSDKQDLLVVIAVYYAFMDIRMYDKAGEKRAIAKAMTEDIAQRNTDTTPRQMGRVGGSYQF